MALSRCAIINRGSDWCFRLAGHAGHSLPCVRSREFRGYLPPVAAMRDVPIGLQREGAAGLALRRAGDEGGEYQADVPTAGVTAGHIWCDVRHLQVSGIDVVQDYGTVQCFALLPAQLL
jgi:hypothetical protein